MLKVSRSINSFERQKIANKKTGERNPFHILQIKLNFFAMFRWRSSAEMAVTRTWEESAECRSFLLAEAAILLVEPSPVTSPVFPLPNLITFYLFSAESVHKNFAINSINSLKITQRQSDDYYTVLWKRKTEKKDIWLGCEYGTRFQVLNKGNM